MQGIHTLAQPHNSKAITHLLRTKKQKHIVSNCIKTQEQSLQNGLSTPFPRLKFLHLAKSKLNVS